MVWMVICLLSVSEFMGGASTLFSTTSPRDFIQLTGHSWVAAMDLRTRQVITNFSVTGDSVTDVDCDPVTERIYWIDDGSNKFDIRSAARDGSNAAITSTEFNDTVNGNPFRFALDPASRLLIFTSFSFTSNSGHIFRTSFEGTTNVTEVVNGTFPTDIVIDMARKRFKNTDTELLYFIHPARQFYWKGGDTIWRADYNGTGRTAIVNLGHNKNWVAMALNAEKGVLYFAEENEGRIEAIHTDGTNRHVVVSNVDLHTLDYYDGNLYFGNESTDHTTLLVVPVDGGVLTQLGPAFSDLYGIHVCSVDHVPQVSATIFLTTSPMNYLQFTGPGWVAAMDLASMQMISNFAVHADMVTDVDCDPVTERIYWTVLTNRVGGFPFRLALDPVSRLMFYTRFEGGIYRSPIDGNIRGWSGTEVVNDTLITDIVIDVARRQFYWTSGDTIWRADYNGNGRTTIVKVGNDKSWVAMALNADKGVLYFAEEDTGYIEAINTDGTNRHVIVSNGVQTPSLDYNDGHLYFINASREDEHSTLMVVPGDGGTATQLGPAIDALVDALHVCSVGQMPQVSTALEGIRLVNGSSPKYGRLEVQVKGQWTGACADFIDRNTASVICNSLGYNRYRLPNDAIRLVNRNGPGTNLHVLQNSKCTGNESGLADCGVPVTYNGSCQSNREVIIDCAPPLEDIVQLQCTSTTWLVKVDTDMLSYRFPGYRPSDIYLGDNSCTGVQNGNRLVFFKDFTDCLTTQLPTVGGVKYVNQLIDGTHDSAHLYEVKAFKWSLELECTDLNNSAYGMLLAFNHSVHIPNITDTPKGYHLEVKLFSDPNFMQPLTGDSLTVPDGTMVYVKAFAANADWSIKMKLNTCYTSSTDGDVIKDYFLIKHGCEVDTNTHFISETMHETKFMFQLFGRTTRNSKVFVHCHPVYCDTSRSDTLLQCENQCTAP